MTEGNAGESVAAVETVLAPSDSRGSNNSRAEDPDHASSDRTYLGTMPERGRGAEKARIQVVVKRTASYETFLREKAEREASGEGDALAPAGSDAALETAPDAAREETAPAPLATQP